jgi:tRNA pseudouridine38-40 synthase
MVRSLVGTLMAVGDGRLDPDSIPAILAARDRRAAGQLAPPHGLTLMRVTYGRRTG